MALNGDAVAAGVVEKADGRRVTLKGGAALEGLRMIADNALSAPVTLMGGASLVGSVATTVPDVLTIVVLGDSTADGDTEWVRLLVDLWDDRYPDALFHYTSVTPPEVDAGWDVEGFTSVDTTASQIVAVWNPSFGGAGYDDYTQAMIDEHVVAPGADIVIMAQGINMAADGSTIEPEFAEVEGWILAGLPDAQFVVSSENPVVSHGGSPAIRDILKVAASSRGYLFVDIYQAFINYGDWESLLIDGVHPNAQGQQLWADYFNAKTELGTSSITLLFVDAEWAFAAPRRRWAFGKVKK